MIVSCHCYVDHFDASIDENVQHLKHHNYVFILERIQYNATCNNHMCMRQSFANAIAIMTSRGLVVPVLAYT